MKVRITDAAWENMLHIGRWIKDRSPALAETVVRERYERCESLGICPAPFPCCPAGKNPASPARLRRLPIADAVEVLQVRHGAVDYERLLFPKE